MGNYRFVHSLNAKHIDVKQFLVVFYRKKLLHTMYTNTSIVY